MTSVEFRQGVLTTIRNNFNTYNLTANYTLPTSLGKFNTGIDFAIKNRLDIEGWMLLIQKNQYNSKDIEELLNYLTNIKRK